MRLPPQGIGAGSPGGKSILEATVDDIVEMLERQPDPDYAALLLARLYDGDTIAAVLNKLPRGRVLRILNSTKMPPSTVESVFSSSNISSATVRDIIHAWIADTALANYGNIVAAINGSQVLADDVAAVFENLLPSVGASRIAKVVGNHNFSVDKARSIFSSTNISPATARDIVDAFVLDASLTNYDSIAAVIEHSNISADDVAAIFQSRVGAVGADRLASVLNSSYLSVGKAAKIVGSTGISADGAAAILSSSKMSAPRIGRILASGAVDLQKVRDILSSRNFTRAVFTELMLDDPVANGRATFNKSHSYYGYGYNADRRSGVLSANVVNNRVVPGEYAELDFGRVSLQQGDTVVVAYYFIMPDYWDCRPFSMRVVVGDTVLLSDGFCGSSPNRVYRDVVTLSEPVEGNLKFKLYVYRSDCCVLHVGLGLVLLAVLR